jgi:hypothetical protein
MQNQGRVPATQICPASSEAEARPLDGGLELASGKTCWGFSAQFQRQVFDSGGGMLDHFPPGFRPPVMETMSTNGLSTRALPTSPPGPVTTFTHAGRKARFVEDLGHRQHA